MSPVSHEILSPSEISENHEVTRKNLEKYVQGCEEIGVRLDTIIRNTIETGKRPIILIPSRGAVPIFLLARKALNEGYPEGSFFSDNNANYYPAGIFDYLEGEVPKDNSQDADVDVILYPFTADVSSEGEKEWLAEKLRKSCSRAVLDLVTGESGKDLDWYKFLVKKLADRRDEKPSLKPGHILESLAKIPKLDSQIILVDTVISGRAANDITDAFFDLQHPAAAVLAVDSTREDKFQATRKYAIEQALSEPEDPQKKVNPFVYFPLLTEDKGSALLGVCAVNFANFNDKGLFSRISSQFSETFLPQSCIWTFPPAVTRERYLSAFRHFIDVAWRVHKKEDIPEEALENLRSELRPLTAKHASPPLKEIQALAQVSQKATAKETASHIVSITVAPEQAIEWVREFAMQLNHRRDKSAA